MEIRDAAHAAEVIKSLSPEKIRRLVKGLKAQHPHLKHRSDTDVRAFLREFIARK